MKPLPGQGHLGHMRRSRWRDWELQRPLVNHPEKVSKPRTGRGPHQGQLASECKGRRELGPGGLGWGLSRMPRE